MTNDNLSRCISELVNLLRNQEQSLEDVRAFNGPSECFGIIWKGFNSKVNSILSKYNFTSKQLIEAAEERTSEKWVYESGLYTIEAFQEEYI